MATELEPGVPKMKLGTQGLEVSAQELGCMEMEMLAFYGPPKPEPEMTELIRHGIHSGVTHLDSSDLHGPFTNEILIGKALRGGMREKVELPTKFGVKLDGRNVEIIGDPAYVRASCEASLKRLDVRSRELKRLVEEGKIKYIGLSEASASTIRRAHAVHRITAVQLEWSLWEREAEKEIISTCRELGIGIVAYSPLGREFFTSGAQLVQNLADGDARKTLPTFQPENLEHNKNLFERVKDMAARKGCTPSLLALAWVHHQGNCVYDSGYDENCES